MFDPQGIRVENDEKQFLAPPEHGQHDARGQDYAIHHVDDMRWGLAICKDMLFARLARQWRTQRGADAGAGLGPRLSRCLDVCAYDRTAWRGKWRHSGTYCARRFTDRH
ncbi:hypothetical protein ACFQS6_15430 [Xanthomonas populi]